MQALTIGKDTKRILIRAPNPIGDLIMATAGLTDIRKAYPDTHITLLVRKAQARVIEGCGFYDELVIDDSKLGLGAMLSLAFKLRKKRFDLCLLYTNSFRTALVAALAGIPRRIGFAKGGQDLLLNHVVQPVLGKDGKWLPMPMPEIYRKLTDTLGVSNTTNWPQLTVTDEVNKKALELKKSLDIDEKEKLIGLAPGASFGQSKLWPPAHFAALADRLSEKYGLRTIMLAGPGEEKITEQIISHMKTKSVLTKEPIYLDLLKPVIRDLALLIATDSGPRHVATPFRVPTVVIMGPTHPGWSGIYLDSQEVIRHDVPCGPCHLKICPLDHRCMIGITPDEVMERIEIFNKRLGIFN